MLKLEFVMVVGCQHGIILTVNFEILFATIADWLVGWFFVAQGPVEDMLCQTAVIKTIRKVRKPRWKVIKNEDLDEVSHPDRVRKV